MNKANEVYSWDNKETSLDNNQTDEIFKDEEVKMTDIKAESNDNEEFNLSQIQIKEDYFEETTDEDLDKRTTSAKKNYFDFSESDKEFNQFEENKPIEEVENEAQKAGENEGFINNDDSVPGIFIEF